MSSLGNAVLSLSTDNSRLNAGLAQAEQHTQSMGMKIASLGAKMAVAAGAALAVGVGASIKAAGDLQQSVANISTIANIVPDEVFKSLNKMSRTVPQSAAQLGDALYNVFSSIDLSPIVDKNGKVIKTITDQGLQLVRQFAEGAVGAGTDTDTFGTAVMGVMNAYKLSVDDATKVSDVFFNTVNKGVISGRDMADTLGIVTGSAKSAGLSINDLGGFMVGITKEGNSARINAEHLNNFFVKMQNPKTADELRNIGISATDSAGNFRPMIDIMDDLKAKTDGLNQSARTSLFDKLFSGDSVAIGAAKTLMSQSKAIRDAIDYNNDPAKAGAAHAAFVKMNATFNSQFAILKNTLVSIGVELGGRLLPIITPIVSWLAQKLPDAMESINKKFHDVFTPVAHDFKVITSIIAADAKDLMHFFSSEFHGAFKGVGHDIQMLVVNTAHFVEWLDGKVRDAIPGFLAFANSVKHEFVPVGVVFDKLKEVIGNAWGAINGIFQADGEDIKKSLSSVAKVVSFALDFGIIGAMRRAYAFLEKFGPKIMVALGSVRHFLPDMLTKAGDAITTFQTTVQKAFDTIIGTVQNLWTEWQTNVGGMKGNTEEAFGAVQNATVGIYNTFQKSWPGIKRAVLEAWEAIKPKVIEMYNNIMKFVTEVAPKVQKAVATLATWITDHWDAIKQTTKTVWDLLSGIINGALAIISTTVKVWLDIFNGDWGKAWDDMKAGFESIWNGFAPFLQDIWDGIKGIIVAGVNAVIQKIDEMIIAFDKITGLNIPAIELIGGGGGGGSKGSGWSGGGPGGHAAGGVWQGGTWSWVGEKGKELVYNGRRDSYVFPHEQSMAMVAAGSGGGSITVVSPIYLDGTQIATVTRKADRSYARRNGG